MRHQARHKGILAAVASLALLTAACTTDDADEAATSGDTTAEETLTTDAEGSDEGVDSTEPSTNESGEAQATETYTIGIGLPFSGPSAFLGEEYIQMVEYGIEDVNEQYAADGIQFVFKAEDTQATAEMGVTAANKLIGVDGAVAVITAWSGVQLAMAPVANDLDSIVLGFGQSPSLRGADPALVNLAPLSDDQLEDLSQYVIEDLGAQRIAMIFVDNASGQGASDSFRELVEDQGAEIVAAESIREGATDAAAQVAKVAASNPDVVYVHTLLVEGAQVFREIRTQGLDVPIASYAGIGESRVIRDAAGDAMDGMLYASHMPENVEEVENTLFARFRADNPGVTMEGQSYNPYAYSAPFLVAEAIKIVRANGDEVTGATIAAAIASAESFDLPLLGTVSYGDDQTIEAPTVIMQISDASADPLTDTRIAVLR
jgi:branched-chain amino acid transport system substrate-binding protein